MKLTLKGSIYYGVSSKTITVSRDYLQLKSITTLEVSVSFIGKLGVIPWRRDPGVKFLHSLNEHTRDHGFEELYKNVKKYDYSYTLSYEPAKSVNCKIKTYKNYKCHPSI